MPDLDLGHWLLIMVIIFIACWELSERNGK